MAAAACEVLNLETCKDKNDEKCEEIYHVMANVTQLMDREFSSLMKYI